MLMLGLDTLLLLLLQLLGPWVNKGPTASHIHPLYLRLSPLSLWPHSHSIPLHKPQYLLWSSQ